MPQAAKGNIDSCLTAYRSIARDQHNTGQKASHANTDHKASHKYWQPKIHTRVRQPGNVRTQGRTLSMRACASAALKKMRPSCAGCASPSPFCTRELLSLKVPVPEKPLASSQTIGTATESRNCCIEWIIEWVGEWMGTGEQVAWQCNPQYCRACADAKRRLSGCSQMTSRAAADGQSASSIRERRPRSYRDRPWQ